MKPKYTQEQYAVCLHGIEANDHFGDIAKATGMNILTVATYAQAKNRKWLKAKARGATLLRKNSCPKQATNASKAFNSSVLNEIFERLTAQQRKQFEAAIIEVVLRQAFLP